MKPIIHIKNLSVGYQDGNEKNMVISNLNTNVMSGELIGVIGQNGIGKSTLLRTITRLQEPISGQVLIHGKDISEYHRTAFSQKVSFVSTEIVKLNHCTVRELVAFGRSPYTNWFGKIEHRDELIIDEAIEMVGLSALASRNINQISDGERQRVMIARTLAQDTDIIVLDEPTAFLDLPNKFEVVHLLSDLTRKKGKTILFSSHDLTIAMKEADRLWLIMPDKFIDGSPEDLVLQHKISDIFKQTRLKFDPKKGDFSIRRKSVGTCQLTGKGTPFIWTKRALERLGFDAESEMINAIINVAVYEHDGTISWELALPDKKLLFTSIYDLAAYLKKY
jgi:iron complex transport system ATP-binding protein